MYLLFDDFKMSVNFMLLAILLFLVSTLLDESSAAPACLDGACSTVSISKERTVTDANVNVASGRRVILTLNIPISGDTSQQKLFGPGCRGCVHQWGKGPKKNGKGR